MQIIRSVKELKKCLMETQGSLGYVPTMGSLHDGHASLIRKCVEENSCTIVSTFINPTQFSPDEDYDEYPRNEISDIKVCEDCNIDILFIPTVKEMYRGNEAKVVAQKELASILEGASRPEYFNGVLTILNKFFNIIKPNKVYFGKKDTQQLILVKNMICSFFMNVEVIVCESIRESDGLLLNSRNAYLDEEEKLLALKLSRSLTKAYNLIKDGQKNTNLLKVEMLKILDPLKVDYVAFVDKEFNPITEIIPGNSIILVAAYVGKTRLIDNIWVENIA